MHLNSCLIKDIEIRLLVNPNSCIIKIILWFNKAVFYTFNEIPKLSTPSVKWSYGNPTEDELTIQSAGFAIKDGKEWNAESKNSNKFRIPTVLQTPFGISIYTV